MKSALLYLFLSMVCISLGANEPVNIFDHNPNFSAMAFETNSIFVTSDGQTYLSPTTGRIDPTKIQEAKTTRESLPAKDFPEGNWGERSQGVQLSLRFDREVYSYGEPIAATVLVRNVTNEFFVFFNSNRVNGQEIDFQAYDQSNRAVASKPVLTDITQPSAGKLTVVIPDTQRKYTDRLNDIYDLTKGSYLIQASIRADDGINTNNEKWVVIKSQKVPIEIK